MFSHIYGILFRNIQGRRGFVVFLECLKTFLSVKTQLVISRPLSTVFRTRFFAAVVY